MGQWSWLHKRPARFECELKSGSSTARKTRLKSKRPVSSAALRKFSSPTGTRTSTSTCCSRSNLLLFLLFASTSAPPLERVGCQLVPVVTNNRHTIAGIPGDLVVGALVPVHERPTPSQAQTRTCGNVREHYGIQRVEAAFQIIDSINADPNILPNITLGIEIRDSCWHSPIALEQAIEFIRDAMEAGEQSPAPHLAAAANKLAAQQGSSSSLLTGILETPVNVPLPPNTSSCPATQPARRLKNIVGVVGPASSQDTVQVQNLLQLFNMPQIGYSATSRDLSNKDFFKFFLRLVPSDKLQALALIDLMLAHNWTYVTIAYTEGSYGSSLMNAFRERAQEMGICFATLESMPPNADDAKFDELIEAIQKHPNARVVVCMCEGRTVGRLFAAFKRHSISNEYLVVGSDGWSDRFDVVENHEEFAQGSISVRIHSSYLHDFDERYFALRPHTNHRNPWFAEFWEQRFQCNLRRSSFSVKKGRQYEHDCTGKESLRDNHKQDSKLAFVQKSIMTMALGLDSLQRATCAAPGLCQEMLPINGSLLLQHLMNVSFSYLGETVYFDQQGDPPGQYDILNFRRRKQLASASHYRPPDGSQLAAGQALPEIRLARQQESQEAHNSYSTLRLSQSDHWKHTHPLGHTNHPSASPLSETNVAPGNSSSTPATQSTLSQANSRSSKKNFEYALYATWKSGDGLSILGGLQWSTDEWLGGRAAAPSSVCSLPCARGHAKRIQSDSAKCCWVCVPCRPHEYLADQFKCQACDKGWWPNAAQTACYQIPIQYLDWRSSEALFALSIALFGLFLTLVTGYIFIRHNDTPVVKSTTRELSYIILLAMLLCHACAFFLVSKPTRTTCFVSRVLPGLAFAMLYGALVTKTNRIARILAGSKKKILTRRPLFMSASAQLLITWIIVLVECSIIVIVLIREPTPDITHAYPSEAQVVLVCNTTTTGIIAPLSFDFFLIAMCTWYAFKTRNVPENFNEAKFIGFTMYTTLVIWMAFVAIYLSSDHKVTALSLCISFSALFPLLLIFFPRCYIILIKPEKNNRSFFTTTKNVRCHIGFPLAAGATIAAPAALSSPGHLSPLQLSASTYLQHPQFASSSTPASASNSLDSQQEQPAAYMAGYGSAKRTSNNQQQQRVSIANCCDGLARVGPVLESGELAAGVGSTSAVANGSSREPAQNNSLWDAMCALFATRSRRKESDKASSIQQHLRAIRRAENLDRQTHFRRSQAQRSLQRFETARLSANILANSNHRRASHYDHLVMAERGANRDSLDSQQLIDSLKELIKPTNVEQLAKRLSQLPEVEQKLLENSRHSVLAMLACLAELVQAPGNGGVPGKCDKDEPDGKLRDERSTSFTATLPVPAAGSPVSVNSKQTQEKLKRNSLLSVGVESDNNNNNKLQIDILSSAVRRPDSSRPLNTVDDWRQDQDDPISRTLQRIMNPHQSGPNRDAPICTHSAASAKVAIVHSKRANSSSSGNSHGKPAPQPNVNQQTEAGEHETKPDEECQHKCHIGGVANKTGASSGSTLMSANVSQRPPAGDSPSPFQHQHQHQILQVRAPDGQQPNKQHSPDTASNWTQKWRPSHTARLSVDSPATANEINSGQQPQARRPRETRRHQPPACSNEPPPATSGGEPSVCTDRCRRRHQINCQQCLSRCRSHCSICRARSRSRARQTSSISNTTLPSSNTASDQPEGGGGGGGCRL